MTREARRTALALLSAVLALAIGACAAPAPQTAAPGTGGVDWDAGNIISDAVFYNSTALPDVASVQAALDKVGGECTAPTCLRNATYNTASVSSSWCHPYSGSAAENYATMLFKMAAACGINPQVAIVMVQKESQGLTRAEPPAALTGVACPDTGPGGSANCDAARAGVFQQTWGLFEMFRRLAMDPSRINYPAGQTSQILWNVAETGCGSAPVAVANTATASLYTFTPYQPNDASIAAYPGTGAACSSYGNRNFFFLFQKYFGPTGGGKATPGSVVANGPNVTIPDNQFVAAAVRGKTIQAPTNKMANGIAAGFGALGMPYVWGGGPYINGSDGELGPNNGCTRGGGSLNSCGSEIGFDCSGLTAYVLMKAGYPNPGGESGTQRNSGQSVPYESGQPGDIVGFPGHVAVYLGSIDGTPYILEASDVGIPIHIVPLTRGDKDGSLHRHWAPDNTVA